ncbi:FAS1-like dehydratase domain-containing protein [Natrarchaeobius oligotrophus]|uniref:FAS1-like dehydratase domain-containing protein n=1 Tax=Natrarchaeobius oligotrophus TaxID=3455743 RepID=UPI00269669D5
MPEKSLEELREMVGTSKVTVEDLHVEAGKVEEFARSIRDDSELYRSEEAAAERGFDGIPAPLTFTRVHMFPRYCPPERRDEKRRGFDLGFDRGRTVHGEQEYEYERPVTVGDTLTGTQTLVDVYQKEGGRGGQMTFAELEIEYRNQDDELVLTERRTRIETAESEEDD